MGERLAEKIADLEKAIDGAPVSRIVSVILRLAVDGGVSDIQIEPVGDESRVRYRIDGVLRTSFSLSLCIHPALVARIKVLANLKLDETRVPQEGLIIEHINGKKIGLRVTTMPVVDNEKVIIRVFDESVAEPTLEQLGYRKEHIDAIEEGIKRPFGLFLIAGPAGSGKSATLFSAVNLLDDETVNISTLEDNSFRNLLRQECNIVTVDEIRNNETAELAVHASLVGHPIFSTLNANSISCIIYRLIGMGIEPFLLAATLNVGINQRLARKICPHCKEIGEIAPETAEKLRREVLAIPKKYLPPNFDPKEPPVFMNGKGCARCGGSGYSGRTAVAEVFNFTNQAKKLVEKGFPADDAHMEAKRQAMLTLRQDLILKALDGITTVEEVLRLG